MIDKLLIICISFLFLKDNVIVRSPREMLNAPCAKNPWISWPNVYLTLIAHNRDWFVVFLAYPSTNITYLWCYPTATSMESRLCAIWLRVIMEWSPVRAPRRFLPSRMRRKSMSCSLILCSFFFLFAIQDLQVLSGNLLAIRNFERRFFYATKCTSKLFSPSRVTAVEATLYWLG